MIIKLKLAVNQGVYEHKNLDFRKISAGLRMHKIEGTTKAITLDSNRGLKYYSKGELTNSRKCFF